MHFIEIGDVEEIALCNETLAKILRKELAHVEQRVIGYPSGYLIGDVHFTRGHGKHVFWWYGFPSDSGDMLVNLFGHGTPGTNETLLIDLQFNFLSRQFKRTVGGAFLRNQDTRELILAHRGIITRGKARIRKDLILAEAELRVESVATQGMSVIDVWPVGPVSDPLFISLLEDFCLEMRRTATAIVDGTSVAGVGSEQVTPPLASKSPSARLPLDGALTEYFDEFSGQTTFSTRDETRAFWEHGKVVAALKRELPSVFVARKSRYVDLVGVAAHHVLLFEVKTDASWQSTYTAIGQLEIHGLMLERMYPQAVIHKVFIAPIRPSHSSRSDVINKLGIYVVPFDIVDNQYTFDGLSTLFADTLRSAQDRAKS